MPAKRLGIKIYPASAYVPATDFSAGDFIAVDLTCQYPINYDTREYALPDWLTEGKIYTVQERKPVDILHGLKIGSPKYDDYLLPPVKPCKPGRVLAVRIDDDADDIGVWVKVIGRTIAGYPACRFGEPAFNAVLRLKPYRMLAERAESLNKKVIQLNAQQKELELQVKYRDQHINRLEKEIKARELEELSNLLK